VDPEIVDSEWMGGNPDGFERLWAPHRMAYVRDASSRKQFAGEDECPLCKKPNDDDRAHLVVHRGEACYVVLNLYPYNPGHLMVVPYRHVGWYTEATDAERDEMGVLTQQAMRVLQTVSGTKGFNIGMNQGVTGGAGISEHLHQHVVPRWVGDANFLPVIARTKAMPELLDDTWQRVSEAWREGA
jgi:ATP adenylyltransferase